MKKIMLIFEDFQESGRTQGILKKIGLDVHAINSLNRLGDQLLSFNPDLIVGWGTNNMSTISIGQKLKEMQKAFKGKAILILPAGERPAPAEIVKARVDVLSEAPVAPELLIEQISTLLGLDTSSLLEKFAKSQIHEPPPLPPPRIGKMGMGAEPEMTKFSAPIEDKTRVAGYQKFLQDIHIDLRQTSHLREEVKKKQRLLRQSWNSSFLESLSDLKRQFAQALFKKNN